LNGKNFSAASRLVFAAIIVGTAAQATTGLKRNALGRGVAPMGVLAGIAMTILALYL
jgi:hypothetical protein